MTLEEVFITGGTGYIGLRLIKQLLGKGYNINALIRHGSENKLPQGCNAVIGDALNSSSFENRIYPATVFIHLVGVAHPSPAKKQLFIDIDLASIKASVAAAKDKGIQHFIYMSVAQPNNVMKDYTEVRMQGEKLIRENFQQVTFLRPFYVLGPAHYWPLLLTPLYKILSLTENGREKVKRLGLVWIGQMINAMMYAIENPPDGIRILEVSDIKKFSKKV